MLTVRAMSVCDFQAARILSLVKADKSRKVQGRLAAEPGKAGYRSPVSVRTKLGLKRVASIHCPPATGLYKLDHSRGTTSRDRVLCATIL